MHIASGTLRKVGYFFQKQSKMSQCFFNSKNNSEINLLDPRFSLETSHHIDPIRVYPPSLLGDSTFIQRENVDLKTNKEK